MRLELCVLALGLALSRSASADSGGADASTEPRDWLAQRSMTTTAAEPAEGGRTSLRSVVLIALVSAIGGGALWLRRKKASHGATRSRLALEVLGSTRVGPKAHAVVARIGGKLVLLGVTDSSVRRLAWLDLRRMEADQGAPAVQAPVVAKPAGKTPGFREMVRDALGLDSKSNVAPPAWIGAGEIRDVYEPSARPPAARTAKLQVESQAKGLLARLEEMGR